MTARDDALDVLATNIEALQRVIANQNVIDMKAQAAQISYFNNVIASADANYLLGLAEAAGSADAAANSIATAVGLPLAEFSANTQLAVKGIIGTRLMALRPQAQAQARAWYY